MKRLRTIWFLAGVVTTSLSWVLSIAFLSERNSDDDPRLLLFAPDPPELGDPEDLLSDPRLAVGGKLRECGADEFEIELPSHGAIYALPINAQNASVADCLIKEFGGPDSIVSLQIEANNAQTH